MLSETAAGFNLLGSSPPLPPPTPRPLCSYCTTKGDLVRLQLRELQRNTSCAALHSGGSSNLSFAPVVPAKSMWGGRIRISQKQFATRATPAVSGQSMTSWGPASLLMGLISPLMMFQHIYLCIYLHRRWWLRCRLPQFCAAPFGLGSLLKPANDSKGVNLFSACAHIVRHISLINMTCVPNGAHSPLFRLCATLKRLFRNLKMWISLKWRELALSPRRAWAGAPRSPAQPSPPPPPLTAFCP